MLSAEALRGARVEAQVTAAAADAAGAPGGKTALRSGVIAMMGLVVLLIGGNLFVDASVNIVLAIGLSERLVGLTLVAVGTSLPELVTSVIAALRGHSDIAIGNVVGSNIFNVLLCLGGAGLVGSLHAGADENALELVTMVLMTLLAATFIRTERYITRAEGAVALASYIAFTAYLITQA